MSRADLSRSACTLARAAEIVGDAWTQVILRELFLGARRFDDIQRATGASPHLLSQRLKRLEAEGVVARRAYSARPPRRDYRLTERGLDLWPVIVALKTWGDRWLGDGAPPPVSLTHIACGRPTAPRLTCSECGERLGARDCRADLSEAMLRERGAAR